MVFQIALTFRMRLPLMTVLKLLLRGKKCQREEEARPVAGQKWLSDGPVHSASSVYGWA